MFILKTVIWNKITFLTACLSFRKLVAQFFIRTKAMFSFSVHGYKIFHQLTVSHRKTYNFNTCFFSPFVSYKGLSVVKIGLFNRSIQLSRASFFRLLQSVCHCQVCYKYFESSSFYFIVDF